QTEVRVLRFKQRVITHPPAVLKDIVEVGVLAEISTLDNLIRSLKSLIPLGTAIAIVSEIHCSFCFDQSGAVFRDCTNAFRLIWACIFEVYGTLVHLCDDKLAYLLHGRFAYRGQTRNIAAIRKDRYIAKDAGS